MHAKETVSTHPGMPAFQTNGDRHSFPMQSAPTVKQRFAALRHLFDLLVPGQIMPDNPARRRADRLRRIDL